MSQLNWNDWKRDAIIALYRRFSRENFRFSETEGILTSSGEITALSNEGYVKRVFRDGTGTVWMLTDDAIDRVFLRADNRRRRGTH